MKVEIIPAMQEHIAHIAANVRDADQQEMFDYLLMSPKEALERSYAVSKLSWTGLIDDEPVAMFGVAPASFLSDTGLPWLIGTDKIEKHQITFLRKCKPYVQKMNDVYPKLQNHVAEYNVKAIRWLAWLGFSFDKPEPMGLFKKPFIKFSMERV